MKVYKKKEGSLLIISNGSEVNGKVKIIALNFSARGKVRKISSNDFLTNYEFYREPIDSELDMYYNDLR